MLVSLQGQQYCSGNNEMRCITMLGKYHLSGILVCMIGNYNNFKNISEHSHSTFLYIVITIPSFNSIVDSLLVINNTNMYSSI